MIDNNRYDFSFTTSSLRLNEMVLVGQAALEGRTIDHINELGAGKSKTGRKMLSEFTKRISKLTADELTILVDGDLSSQKQMAFLAVCKTYGMIRDFVIEVLREKMLVFDYRITEGDYISFFRTKLELHTELETLTDMTYKKIKQVIFKILEQAGIIDNIKSKIIQPQLLDVKVMNAITSDDRNWLKVFFISDVDIAKVN